MLLPLVYLQNSVPTIIASNLKIDTTLHPNLIMAYTLDNNTLATADFSTAFILVNAEIDKVCLTSAFSLVTDVVFILTMHLRTLIRYWHLVL